MFSSNRIKKHIKKRLNNSGWDFHRLTIRSNPGFHTKVILDHFGVNLVFDVGANSGGYGMELRRFGYKGSIVSFEPLEDAYQSLLRSSEDDSHWTIHPRTAIGDFEGNIQINIAGNSTSSSVLPMKELHSTVAEQSKYIGIIDTPITTLDTAVHDYLSASSVPFVKIDTQGYEWKVLNGASKILKLLKGIQCEISLVPLYEGQHLWLDILKRLENEGFSLWAFHKGFSDHKSGRMLQVDAIFIRE
jgi:FkbM family methyltransferase